MSKDYSDPLVQYWAGVSGMLWWAAAVLGVLCMIDTLHQACTYNLWQPFRPLYYLYYPTLASYAGARDKEKRVRRAEKYEKYTGEFFVYGWGLILIFIFLANSTHCAVAYPPTLTQTLAVVGGVFLGVKYVAPAIWPMPPAWEDIPDAPTPNPNAPLPGPTPGPIPAPTPNPSPAPDLAAEIRQSCQVAGTFTSADIADVYNLSIPRARGYIIQLIIEGVVVKLGHDHFQWKG